LLKTASWHLSITSGLIYYPPYAPSSQVSLSPDPANASTHMTQQTYNVSKFDKVGVWSSRVQ